MEGIAVSLVILLLIAIFTSRSKIYIPQGWHFTGPTAIILLGVAILKYTWEKYGEPAAQIVLIFANAPFTAVAWYWSRYLYEAGVLHQKYVTRGAATTTQQEEPEEKTELVFTPTLRAIPELKAQTVAVVKIDAEQKFARTLIDQRNHNLEVNMTETYWIKGKRFDGSRDEFVQMLERWEYHGLSERAGKQQKRVPKDWRMIRLVAQGEKLPPPLR